MLEAATVWHTFVGAKHVVPDPWPYAGVPWGTTNMLFYTDTQA